MNDSYMELDSQLALLDGGYQEPALDEKQTKEDPIVPDSSGKNLATFTHLPKTPDKQLRNICRSMVREATGAMVAVPSSQLNFNCSSVFTMQSATTTCITSPIENEKRADYSCSYPTESVNTHSSNKEQEPNVSNSSQRQEEAESEDSNASCEEIIDSRSYTGFMELTSINIEGFVDVLRFPPPSTSDAISIPSSPCSAVVNSAEAVGQRSSRRLERDDLTLFHPG